MPVRKFHSVEEMPGEHWREPGDAEFYRVMRSLWEMARRTRRHRFPPGVYRYRSIEEMSVATERRRCER